MGWKENAIAIVKSEPERVTDDMVKLKLLIPGNGGISFINNFVHFTDCHAEAEKLKIDQRIRIFDLDVCTNRSGNRWFQNFNVGDFQIVEEVEKEKKEKVSRKGKPVRTKKQIDFSDIELGDLND